MSERRVFAASPSTAPRPRLRSSGSRCCRSPGPWCHKGRGPPTHETHCISLPTALAQTPRETFHSDQQESPSSTALVPQFTTLKAQSSFWSSR